MTNEQTPLRIARKRRKLTLQQLADTLGVSLAQMSRIERNGTTSLPHALKLGELLKLHPRSFAPKDRDAA